MRAAAVMAGLALMTATAAAPAAAQPRPREPAGPTVADRGSAVYRFEQVFLRSEDGARAYRITLCIPRGEPPSGGWPVIYALDGGLALAALDEVFLARLARGRPAVLVAVAHEGETAVDPVARAFDYTPAPDGVRPGEAADHAGRAGGGADIFLDLLDRRIRPEVERRVAVDAARETLWGHSYGGLLTLHAALTRPFLFDRYVAASPSLWWNYGSVLAEEAGFLAGERPPGFSLTLLVGEIEQAPPAPDARPRHPMWTSLAPGETGRLAERLAARGADVRFAVIPGQGHGGMFGAALTRTLLEASGLTETAP